MAFVSLTRLRLRSWRHLPAFALHAIRSRRQAERTIGFIDGSLLADRRLTFWTMTRWTDRSAMRSFMLDGAHQRSMPRLMHWCDEASVAHWDAEDRALPDWADADRRMRRDGRPSKVLVPSPDHAGMTFAAPRRAAAVPMRAGRGAIS